jgi:CheY-like chemotaxis protein
MCLDFECDSYENLENLVNQSVALAILKKMGFKADAQGNCLEKIGVLESVPYAVVFTDVQMPTVGGFEATLYISDYSTLVLDNDIKINAMAAAAHALDDLTATTYKGLEIYTSNPCFNALFSTILIKSRKK